jgi:hypothetical protein
VKISEGTKAKGQINYLHIAESKDSATEPEEYMFTAEKDTYVAIKRTWLASINATSHIVSDQSLSSVTHPW